MNLFEQMKDKFADEVKEKWGDTQAFAQFQEIIKDSDQLNESFDKLSGIFEKFSQCNTTDPASEQALSLVKELQDGISGNFYDCSKEILAGLGQMYVSDERFKNNLDKYKEGTAQFISDAIKNYCSR